LQGGNPRKLVIMGMIDGDKGIEAALHVALSQQGLQAQGEWFRAEGPLAWCAFTEPPLHDMNIY
jgi:hypothetical protein